jgi:hypothetical protein
VGKGVRTDVNNKKEDMKTKKGFVLRDVCGENVILAEGIENIDFNSIISLNETAAFIWRNVEGKDFDVEYMAEKLQEEYDVNKKTALKDCETLAAKWLEAGIVE